MPVNILLISLAFLILSMALGQLLIKNQRRANKWLFWLLLNCFIWILHAVCSLVGLIDQYPHLNKLYVPFFAVSTPLWYIYIRALYETDLRHSFRYQLIIPIAVTVCLSIPFYFESESFKREHIEANIDTISNFMMYMATRYAELTGIVYSLMTMRFLKRVSHNKLDNYSINTTSILWVFSMLIMLAGVVRIVGVAFDISIIKVVVPTMIIACILLCLYLLSYRTPVVLGLDRSDSTIRNFTADDERLIEDIRQKIIAEKWHLDPDLKLQKLARKLSLSPKILSELINQAEGVNFNYFINQLRIQHAKSLIAADPQLSNDDIAYNSGFNSRTLFYGKFKQFTGATPTQFKNKTKGCNA